MNHCLVTGGAGFIGSHIVRALVKRGCHVRIIDDLSTGDPHRLSDVESQVELVVGDICHDATCQRVCEGVDTIFHLAARASVPRSIEYPVDANFVNVNGTMNLLVAAKAAGARRFVYSASSSAYGDTPTLPKREDMTPRPLSPYAVSKLAAEHY